MATEGLGGSGLLGFRFRRSLRLLFCLSNLFVKDPLTARLMGDHLPKLQNYPFTKSLIPAIWQSLSDHPISRSPDLPISKISTLPTCHPTAFQVIPDWRAFERCSVAPRPEIGRAHV